MATGNSTIVRMVSSAGTGFCYYTTLPKGKTSLEEKKYDKIARMHVIFKSSKKLK